MAYINFINMNKHNTVLLCLALMSIVSFGQKVVFKENYKSITDVDNNNWQYNIEFKKGDSAEYIGRSKVEKNYHKVKARGEVVFVYETSFIDIDKNLDREWQIQTDEEAKLHKERIRLQDEQIAKTLKEREAEKARTIKARNDRIRIKYGESVLNRLLKEGLYIGMPENLVMEYLGQPKKVNRTVTASGEKEQWVYESRYCYIENGKLTAWQESY